MRYFAAEGYNVHLVTFDKTGQIEGVEIHNLRYFSKFAYPFRILEVDKTIKKIDPDVLHSHYVSHYGMYGALTGFKPFVVSAWGSDVLVEPKQSLVKRRVVKYVLRKADLITVDSTSSMTAVVSLGVDEAKVKLIKHGVDLRVFHSFEKRAEFRKDIRIPQSHKVVISTRSLEPIYDVGTLIKAVPYVLEKCPHTYFLIIGDGPLRSQLKELAYELGVTENVRLVGFLKPNEVPKFLGISDIYVSTSLSDTTSVSLLEAMACGLPVVVTDLDGNREWVENGANGFLFHQGDCRALAEKIVFLIRDEDIRKKFGVVNRRIVEKKGDYEKEMKKMKELYEKLVEAYQI